MCTVTYIPGNADKPVILTSNRDENTKRKQSSKPKINQINNLNILAPIDMQAGGSWIGASEKGRIACLLNGAFLKHKRKENYRLSRGLVFLDNFLFDKIDSYAKEYIFEDIEPFTLVIIETKPKTELYQLKWTGEKVFFEKKNEDKPHIWSSATLYNEDVAQKREGWFRNWLDDSDSRSPEILRDFHCNGGSSAPANERINLARPDGIQTVSTTQLVSTNQMFQMLHFNHLTGEVFKESLDLN